MLRCGCLVLTGSDDDVVHPDEVKGSIGLQRAAERMADVRNDRSQPANLSVNAILLSHTQQEGALARRRGSRDNQVRFLSHHVKAAVMLTFFMCCASAMAVPSTFLVSLLLPRRCVACCCHWSCVECTLGCGAVQVVLTKKGAAQLLAMPVVACGMRIALSVQHVQQVLVNVCST